jgi:hypothetical protein
MAERPPVRVVIELEGPSPDPQGWLARDGDARRSFDGWLQLLAALQEVIGGEADPQRLG